MSATVKRDKSGEITHVRIGAKFYTKADADKINFADVDITKYLNKCHFTKHGMAGFLSDLINQRATVEEWRIQILQSNGEIEQGGN